MESRDASSASHTRAARLAIRNDFPARDRAFISTLAEDLHLSVRWDEYDDNDVNLVTWRFPGALEEPLSEVAKENGDSKDGEGEWEDVEGDDDEEDEESKVAVDRVLKKYEKAHITNDDEGGGFDARYEASVKEKMDEWKRGYYKACLPRSSIWKLLS